MTVSPPFPWSFMLRYANQNAVSNVGFVCKPQGKGVGLSWAEQLFGAIPNRLSSGVPDLNDTSNVSYQAWENLANGGIGAFDASDASRYRFGVGAYTGDASEIYLQAAATEFTKNAGVLIAGQTIKQIVPWYIPSAQQANGTTVTALTLTASSGGSLRQATTYAYQVTGVTGSVESTPCTEVTVATGTNQSVHIMWTVPANGSFNSFNVYRAEGAGNNDKKLYFSVAGNHIYTDGATQYRVIDNGTTTAGKTISSSGAALAATPIRKLIILADDGTNTFLYEVPFSGTGINGANSTMGSTIDVLRQTMLTSGTTGINTKGLTDGSGSAIADDTLVASLSGVLAYNACTIYTDHLIVPTTNTAGTQVVRHIYYDSNATHPGLQVSDLTGQLGSRAFGESTTRLWLFSNNLAYWCSEPFVTTPTWNGPIPVGDRNTTINSAIMHGGTMINDSALYLAKADGLFRILDTDQGPQTRAEKVGALGMVDDNNGSFMCNHRGELYIGGRHVVFRYTIGQMDNSGPNKNLGLCPSLITTFYDGVSTGRHFLALGSHINNVSGTSTVLQTPDPLTGSNITYYGYQQIFETAQGEAWAQFHHSCTSSDTFSETVAPAGQRWTGRSMEIVTTNVSNDWCATLVFAGGDNCRRLFRQPLRNHEERLREAPNYTPAAFGRMRFPQYYTEHAQVDKLWQWLQVYQSPLVNAPGATLTLLARLYSPDRQPDAAAIQIGFDAADGTTGRFYTTPNAHRHYLNRLVRGDGSAWVGKGLDVELQFTPSIDARTPVFSSVALTYSEAGLALHRWTFNIELGRPILGANNTKLAYSSVTGIPDMDTATDAGLKAYVNLLVTMATNERTLILTDPFGNEYPVRIDLSPMSWSEWESKDTGPNPQAGSCTITCTQLYVA